MACGDRELTGALVRACYHFATSTASEQDDEPLRVWALKPGGTFLLNIRDLPRNKERISVTNWHVSVLTSLGLIEGGRVEAVRWLGPRGGRA